MTPVRRRSLTRRRDEETREQIQNAIPKQRSHRRSAVTVVELIRSSKHGQRERAEQEEGSHAPRHDADHVDEVPPHDGGQQLDGRASGPAVLRQFGHTTDGLRIQRATNRLEEDTDVADGPQNRDEEGQDFASAAEAFHESRLTARDEVRRFADRGGLIRHGVAESGGEF